MKCPLCDREFERVETVGCHLEWRDGGMSEGPGHDFVRWAWVGEEVIGHWECRCGWRGADRYRNSEHDWAIAAFRELVEHVAADPEHHSTIEHLIVRAGL